MALVRTLLEDDARVPADTTEDTAAFSPTSGAFLIIDVYEVDSGPGGAAPTLSDSVDSLTYTQRETVQWTDGTTWTHRLTRFTAVPTSGSSRAITITTFTTLAALLWSVRQYTGQHATTPYVQDNSASGNSTAPATTLSAFGAAGNFCDTAVGAFDGASTITLNGVTASDTQVTGAEMIYRAGYVNGEDTAPDATLGSSNRWGIIASEIAEAAAAGGGAWFGGLAGPGGLGGPGGLAGHGGGLAG